jgi:hypothetical protein
MSYQNFLSPEFENMFRRNPSKQIAHPASSTAPKKSISRPQSSTSGWCFFSPFQFAAPSGVYDRPLNMMDAAAPAGANPPPALRFFVVSWATIWPYHGGPNNQN